MNKVKDFARAAARGLGEFLTPRDWVPSIPLPPVGPWKPTGAGCMSLYDALRGFPEDDG